MKGICILVVVLLLVGCGYDFDIKNPCEQCMEKIGGSDCLEEAGNIKLTCACRAHENNTKYNLTREGALTFNFNSCEVIPYNYTTIYNSTNFTYVRYDISEMLNLREPYRPPVEECK